MRITGGNARGIRLQTPRGYKTRPASDVLREGLFSSLGSTVMEKRFADLFAGSGSYGLEAWSRGAAGGCFVEKNPACVACISENIARVAKSSGLNQDSLSIFRSDVFKCSGIESGVYHLVFADPPYELLRAIETGLFALVQKMLADGGSFILEKPANLDLHPIGWTIQKQLGKKRGDGPSLAIFKRSLPGKLSGQD